MEVMESEPEEMGKEPRSWERSKDNLFLLLASSFSLRTKVQTGSGHLVAGGWREGQGSGFQVHTAGSPVQILSAGPWSFPEGCGEEASAFL